MALQLRQLLVEQFERKGYSEGVMGKSITIRHSKWNLRVYMPIMSRSRIGIKGGTREYQKGLIYGNMLGSTGQKHRDPSSYIFGIF